MRSAPVAALVALVCGASAASAENSLKTGEEARPYVDPDQAEDEETAFRREGFAIGVGLGPALFLGSGDHSYARAGGGGFSLRLGTSAGENLLWFVQLDAATHAKKSGASLLGVGAHYYFRDALWVRGSLALANVFTTDDEGTNITEGGLALVAGFGADVYRRGIFAVDVEFGLSRAGFPNGGLSMGLFQVMANWY